MISLKDTLSSWSDSTTGSSKVVDAFAWDLLSDAEDVL
eukprot:CAMPEP_0181511912 /NCGR_PEP_ID=MMETSP1110-20121109/61688_1 /TAXON_ID=174948 /ORGANISM="Symbiodinium sp., Strain CCMP421" /LENGTH=37 /DNA_ID= /DNA_START= /DNA_END= /DNA_ORIENTATION=